MSRELLDEIKRAMKRPKVRLDHLVMAFEAISDRGGFLAADKQANVDISSLRLLVLAAALRGLSEKQRADIMAMLGQAKSEHPPS